MKQFDEKEKVVNNHICSSDGRVFKFFYETKKRIKGEKHESM